MKVTICAASVLALALATAPSLVAQDSQVERGKYLVGITGCHDCHSPKMPVVSRVVPLTLLSLLLISNSEPPWPGAQEYVRAKV